MTIRTYIYQSWVCSVFLFPSALLPVHVWSQWWRSTVRRNPGPQSLPLLLSFRQHHVVPGSQFSPGCPGLLWLHLDQMPQGLLGYMSCMSTSRFVHHDYKMDKIEQAAKNRKSQWQTATVVALHNFTCHLAFQSKPGSSFLIFQVLIGFFLNVIANCDFVKRNLFPSKEAVFVKMLILIV